MPQSQLGHRQTLFLAVSVVIAGCQTAPPLAAPSPVPSTSTAAVGTPQPNPASSAGSAVPAGTMLPSGVVVPQGVRVVHVIPDPKLNAQVSVNHYWDYGKDAPFDVKQFVSVSSPSTAGPNYAAHTTMKAQVNVLSLLGAHYRVLAQNATTTSNPMLAGCDPAPPMTIGAATPASSPIATVAPANDANASASLPATDDAQVVGTAPIATAVSAVNQPDALGTQALTASEAGPDPSFPPVNQAAQYLSTPHPVDIEADVPWVQLNADCLVSVTDQTTGDRLKLSYDQAFQHFTLTSANGSLDFEINPDRSFLVDGQGAADVPTAITIVEASPVIRKASLFSLAMLTARLARLAPPQSRTAADDGNNGETRGYRLLGVSSDNQGLCYVILDAVVKHLVKAGNAAAAG